MTTLFVLREPPGAGDFDVLAHAGEGDAALLLQDAVRSVDDVELPAYASEYDLRIRDVEEGDAERVDYDDIADLLEDYDRILSL